MDPIEEKIKTLKSSMHSVEQPDRMAIWQGISKTDTAPKKTYKAACYWIIVTMIVLIWGCFVWWRRNTHALQKEAEPIAHLPLEWQVKAREYQVLVRQREQQVQNAQADKAVIAKELQVVAELEQLQAAFLADFETLPKDERTAARYLRYYEQKMRIMELIIKKIDIQKYETERNIQQAG